MEDEYQRRPDTQNLFICLLVTVGLHHASPARDCTIPCLLIFNETLLSFACLFHYQDYYDYYYCEPIETTIIILLLLSLLFFLQ